MTPSWNTPAFVSVDHFASGPLDRELIDVQRKQKQINGAGAIAIVCVVLSMVCLLGRLPTLRWEWLFASGAIAITLIMLINQMRNIGIEILGQRAGELSPKLTKAKALCKDSVFFSNDQSMWWKLISNGKNPREEVYEWCVANQVPAILAIYDDPMFGHFGILVHIAQEDFMVLFKLKYMDKI